MAISPISSATGLPLHGPRPEELTRAAGGVAPHDSVAPPERPPTAAQSAEALLPVQATTDLASLRSMASDMRLELRLRALPETNVVLIRIVEPETGEVVREFPPEGLAEALAEMREKAASHLNRQV